VTLQKSLRYAFLPLVALVLLIAGCTATTPISSLGTMGITLQLPSAVTQNMVRSNTTDVSTIDMVALHIEAAEGDYSIDLEPSVVGSIASTQLQVSAGIYYLSANLYGADGTHLGTGEGTAVVLPGSTTQAQLVLTYIQGALEIDITWDDAAPLFVADISQRPVLIDLSGIGTFQVSGLSRIGWDTQVFESYLSKTHTVKEAGLTRNTEVAMLFLRGSETAVESLAAWTQEPDPRNMLVILKGIGGEAIYLELGGVLPVSANTDTFDIDFSEDTEMGGVRISFDTIGITYEPEPRGSYYQVSPGWEVEIEGVLQGLYYNLDDLVVPDPGSNPSFWLTSASLGGELIHWAELTRDMIRDDGYPDRHAGSMIRINNQGDEVWRNNYFEMWPASINLFNPLKPYGQSHLIDVHLVAEVAERG
jgi:hypothetical protein